MTPADTCPLALRRRALPLLALALPVGLAAAAGSPDGPVAAHAVLLAVRPANGSVVAEPPAEVVLTFSEPVSLSGGSARVLDDGAATVSGEPRVDGSDVLIPMGSDVGTGTFTVAFEVISVDSHRISGATVFHVGAPSLSNPVTAAGGADELPWWMSTLAVAFGLAAYATALLGAGLWWFAVFTARAMPGESALGSRIAGVAERAAALGIVVLAAGLPARIARTSGGTAALADDSVLLAAVRGPLGVAALVGIVGLGGLAAGIASVRRSGGRGTTAAAFGLLALAGFAFEGHTRSQRPLALMVAFDLVHVVAGAVWLGGIAGLVLAFRARTDPAALAAAVARFSSAAVWAVVGVSAAGAGMAWIVLPSPAALTSTGYGLTMLLKVALVIVVIALGAYNRRALVPKIAGERAPSARRRLARTVHVELVVLLAVLAVTAVLVTRSPAPTTIAAPAAATVTEAELTGDAGSVTLTLDPGTVGANTLRIDLVDAAAQPLVPIEPPLVSLSEPTLDLGPLRSPSGADDLGGSAYAAAVEIPVEGDWQVMVRVRLDEFSVVTATATMPVARP